MKAMLQKQVYSPIRIIVALSFIITVCSGIIHSSFNCSNYTFHENSTNGRDWQRSRELCQNLSGGDLVSIEEENEWIFLKEIVKNLKTVKYYIGLKKSQGEWRWLSNGNSVNAAKGESPWSPGEPTGNSDQNCATIYGNYKTHLDGLFDDLSCGYRAKDAGYICKRAAPCTKEEKGGSDNSPTKASSGTAVTQTSPVEFTSRPTAINTSQGQVGLDASHSRDSSGTVVTKTTATESTTQPTTMIKKQGQGPSSTRKTEEAAAPTITWQSQPTGHSPAKEIAMIATETAFLKRPDESSHLITIIVSVLAFVILGIGVALWFFFVYRPRKNGSESKIQQHHRQNNSTQLRRHSDLSPPEERMDNNESLPEVQRQDTCVDIEEGDRGSFLSMPQSSTKRHEEAFIKEQSSVDDSCASLNISATTKTSKKNNTSKELVKKDTPELNHVCAIVHIHPKQDKAAFHLDPATQDLGECPSQLTVDEEECKASVGLSSSRLEKELTRNEEAILKQNAPGQDQCNNCVYAVVDKTKKKRQPPKKPAPYNDLLYADLSHSPKKSDNGRIHQESTATVYADIDHIKSSAMGDSRLQQENEVKLT